MDEVKEVHPDFPLEPLKKAYQVAEKAHEKQQRRSGEPYIVHPVEVVRILLQMNVDLPSLIAGLLHDTVEDTRLSLEDVKKDFGEEVAFLVDGVTKLSKLSFKSSHRLQAENFRKMIMAMGRDIRVILIKIADRTHNMRTLQFMSPQKQMLIASETEEIYAPLAHRLGINWLKTELQDLCLRYLRPDTYFKLVELVAQTKESREKYLQEVIELLREKIKASGIENLEITGRSKNFYSIYRKMEKNHLSFEDIHDLLAFRIICEDIRSCYQSLGIIHSLYKPVPGRFKDYIAMPKANRYQSLHTTVVGPKGQRIEVQIRTHEMHRIAEYGIAAHWTYKSDGSVDNSDVEKFSWVRKLVEQNESVQDPSEFLNSLKMDLFEEEVFVFSPKGDVVALPRNACPIDFAYAIHSEIGSHCVGAKVNGRLVPLRHPLQSGDEVEIITSEGQNPRKDWLDFVVTGKARAKIRAFVKKAQRDESYTLGQKLMEREFRKIKVNFSKLQKMNNYEEAVRAAGAANEEDLLIKVGYGKIVANDAMKAIAKSLELEHFGEEDSVAKPVEQTNTPKRQRSQNRGKDRSPVVVEGIDNIMIRFAKCCSPLPGEPIVGFVSRGRGIVVHAADCEYALNLDPERKFDLDWDPGREEQFKAGIKVTTEDRPGMLAEISQVISNSNANISNARVQMHSDNKASIFFEVSLANLHHLHQLITKIEGLGGVLTAERYWF